MSKLKAMGYFNAWAGEEALARQEYPGTLVHDETDRIAVLAFMDAAKVHQAWKGMADCRVCRCRVGACCMVTPDGKWKFPQNWQHYIIEHDMAPTGKFVADALRWWHRRKRNVWNFLEYLEDQNVVLVQKHADEADVIKTPAIKALVKRFMHEKAEETVDD